MLPQRYHSLYARSNILLNVPYLNDGDGEEPRDAEIVGCSIRVAGREDILSRLVRPTSSRTVASLNGNGHIRLRENAEEVIAGLFHIWKGGPS
jgi:hypothetical protein